MRSILAALLVSLLWATFPMPTFAHPQTAPINRPTVSTDSVATDSVATSAIYGQQTVTLLPRQDTYISEFTPDTPNTTSQLLTASIQSTFAQEASSILIQFDLSEIPAGSRILLAELSLFQRSALDGPIAIDRIAEPWDIQTTTWNNQPAFTAYLPGAPATTLSDVYLRWELSSLVEQWLDPSNPIPNHGLHLRIDAPQSFGQIRSFDSSRAENPPQLRVSYMPPAIEIPGNGPAIQLDPECAVNNIRYKDGAVYTYFHNELDGHPTGLVHLIADDEALYVCVLGYGDANRFIGVYIDTLPPTPPDTLPSKQHLLLRTDIEDGRLSAWRGDDNPDMVYLDDSQNIVGWDAVSSEPATSVDLFSAEYRIPLDLLGPSVQCGASFGIAVAHQLDARQADVYGWPNGRAPSRPDTWITATLENATCIRVICAETNTPCTPAADVIVANADTGEIFGVDADGYVMGAESIVTGARIWARLPVSVSQSVPYTLYHTSGLPQTVNPEAFDPQTLEMLLFIERENPLMLYDLDLSSQWRIDNDPAYASRLEEKIVSASEYLYRYSSGQIALGNVTGYQDWAGWESAHIRLHANNNLRPDATLGGINREPLLDPDNDQLPPETEGQIIYWPGHIRIGSAWNRFNKPLPADGFDVDIDDDWSMVLGHELGHYLLYLLDTYFKIGPRNTIVNVYSCTGSAMGWVYFPENHGFVADPVHWEENCRDTYGNDLLNRSEWRTLSRFFPWLIAPDFAAELFTAPLPAGLTRFDLQPAHGESPGVPNQPIALDYQDDETASTRGRAFLFRHGRIIDQGGPAQGETSIELVGSQVGDRFCLFDIDAVPQSPATPRHQFGCRELIPGDNLIPLRKDSTWAPVILVTPVSTQTVEVEISQPLSQADASQLAVRLYPEDSPGWFESSLAPVDGKIDTFRATFNFTPPITNPITSAFIQVYIDESAADASGFSRREAIVDYGANGGGLPGPTSSLGHAPIVASSDGQAVFLLTRPITLAVGDFIAWQSMIGRPPALPGFEPLEQAYRLIALPAELASAGVVSIRFPSVFAAQARIASVDELAPEGSAIHFWNGENWEPLETDFVLDPNGEVLASAPSNGVGNYALFVPGQAAPENRIYIPFAER